MPPPPPPRPPARGSAARAGLRGACADARLSCVSGWAGSVGCGIACVCAQICPLTGDWKAKLRERYELDQIETRFGGELDLSTRPVLPVLPYTPVPYAQILGDTEAQAAATEAAREDAVSGVQGHQGAGSAHREATPDSDQAHARRAAVGEGALGEGGLGVSDGTVGMGREQKLELVTSECSPEPRSKGHAAAIKCLPPSPLSPTAESRSVGAEGEDEFLTPNASPRQSEHMSPASMRSAESGPAGQGGEVLLEADTARQEEPSERTRAAIVVGTSGGMAGSMAGINAAKDRMRRSDSELELVAHKHQVLHSAHGGIFDAHTHAERAAVMTTAIHSMTEAGLDEEVAKKVFELDKNAVARVLAAASNGAGGASPRGACLEELLALCAEFGIKTRRASTHESNAPDSEGMVTGPQPPSSSSSSSATEALPPLAPPLAPPAALELGNVNVNSWMHAPMSPRTPTEVEHGDAPGAGHGGNSDGGLQGVPRDGLLITDEFLRETMERTSLRARNGPWVAEQTVLADGGACACACACACVRVRARLHAHTRARLCPWGKRGRLGDVPQGLVAAQERENAERARWKRGRQRRVGGALDWLDTDSVRHAHEAVATRIRQQAFGCDPEGAQRAREPTRISALESLHTSGLGRVHTYSHACPDSCPGTQRPKSSRVLRQVGRKR